MLMLIFNGFAVLVSLFIGLLFLFKSKRKKDTVLKIIFRIIAITFLAPAIIGTGHFVYIGLFKNWSVWSILITTLFTILVFGVICLILKIYTDREVLIGMFIIAIMLTIVIGLTLALCCYENNLKPSETPLYEETKYPLISVVSGIEIEGNIEATSSVRVSSRRFFVQSTIIENNVNGQIKQKEVYKIYYLNKKNEGLPFKLDIYDTPLKFDLKEGEKPYMLRKKYTNYTVDYNKNPPEKVDLKKPTYKFELHIRKDSILEVFKINQK